MAFTIILRMAKVRPKQANNAVLEDMGSEGGEDGVSLWVRNKALFYVAPIPKRWPGSTLLRNP